MNRTLIVSIGAIVIIGASVYLYSSSQSPRTSVGETSQTSQTSADKESLAPGATNPTPTPAPTPKPSGITLAEVAKHKSATSCWTAINGGVYDLTKWIAQHPGGEGAILSLCGTDGSAAFNAQHGGQEKQERTLATFKIGILAK